MDQETPQEIVKGKKVRGSSKHDWNAIFLQYFLCEHEDWITFLRAYGYPITLKNNPRAKKMALQKRLVIDAARQRERDALIQDRVREREERRIKILKELEDGGRMLRACIMNEIVKDLHITGQRAGESVDAWVNRTRHDEWLKPGEKMAIAVAMKHADELIRKASGLEDFDWESETKKNAMLEKANKLEFEIVQTSQGKPIAELPFAPEEKLQA